MIKRISIPVVILGVTLSTMHQSSLGSLFLIVPLKMHQLWYTPLLPVVFLVSAIAAGFGMVIFECAVSHRVFRGQPRPEIFRGLARGLLVTLVLILILKVGDLIFGNELNLIFEGSYQSYMFILENIIGVLLPIGILSIPKFRQKVAWIFRAGLLTVFGIILHRTNIGLISMAGAAYFPHWMELAVTLGLFSGGILIFGVALKNLPIQAKH